MSRELGVVYFTGATLYAHLVRDSDGTVWNVNTSAFVTADAANWADYAIAVPELAVNSGYYYGDKPDSLATGDYTYFVYRATTAPTYTFADNPPIAMGRFSYNAETGILTPLTLQGDIAEGSGDVVNEAILAGGLPVVVGKQQDYKRMPTPPGFVGLTTNIIPGDEWPSVTDYAGIPLSIRCFMQTEGGTPYLPVDSWEYDLHEVTDEGNGFFTRGAVFSGKAGRSVLKSPADLPYFFISLAPADRKESVAVVLYDHNKTTGERTFLGQLLVIATAIANVNRL